MAASQSISDGRMQPCVHEKPMVIGAGTLEKHLQLSDTENAAGCLPSGCRAVRGPKTLVEPSLRAACVCQRPERWHCQRRNSCGWVLRSRGWHALSLTFKLNKGCACGRYGSHDRCRQRLGEGGKFAHSKPIQVLKDSCKLVWRSAPSGLQKLPAKLEEQGHAVPRHLKSQGT